MTLMRTSRRLVAGAVLTAAALTGCSSSKHDGPRARSDIAEDTGPGVISQHVDMSTPFTLQAGDICTTGGKVRISKVEPLRMVGKLLVTDWGTRRQEAFAAGGDNDPAGERVTLASLGGFSKAPFELICKGNDGNNVHQEFNVELKAATPDAKAAGFTVTYNNGQTFVVPLKYERCITANTTNLGCSSAASTSSPGADR